MSKKEWIEQHMPELQNIQMMPEVAGALAFAELADEFFWTFGETLLENLEEENVQM